MVTKAYPTLARSMRIQHETDPRLVEAYAATFDRVGSQPVTRLEKRRGGSEFFVTYFFYKGPRHKGVFIVPCVSGNENDYWEVESLLAAIKQRGSQPQLSREATRSAPRFSYRPCP